jgi:hypothetical protein
MTTQVILNLPDNLYRQVRRLARRQRAEVTDTIAQLLASALPDSDVHSGPKDWATADPVMEREMQAWIALYPLLRQQFHGKHVAIHAGQVIDTDDDFSALYTRIDAAYPDEFVWMSKVEDEPITTLTFRSPRLVQ